MPIEEETTLVKIKGYIGKPELQGEQEENNIFG